MISNSPTFGQKTALTSRRNVDSATTKTMKKPISAPCIAILDANVLFPYRKRDILLRFSEARIFQAQWTEQIIREWTRNLLFLKPHLKGSPDSQLIEMEKHFPDAVVSGYES